MHLKRIEFLGFKSFAPKTVLESPKGVTAIVGPNGSGKSNVIDGLRWVLGERDAKNIRADKSESLIFSGTSQRARASLAQVSITLDNSTKFFPIDYAEITIRRKVTRGGVSQYFLNEAEVRLKDIIGFLSQARLGTRGFSIINQGNSDIFISASAAERRIMMGEILGLRQYQLKRHEAELKLESANINADKVHSLIEEILPHLRLLRRQTKKWEKHGALAEELKDLEQQYFAFRLQELKNEEEKLKPETEKLNSAIAEKKKELDVLQKDLAAVEKRQPQGDKHFDDFKKKQTGILNRRSQIQKELGRLEAELEFLLSRPKSNLKESELTGILTEVRGGLEEVVAGNIGVISIKEKLTNLIVRIKNALAGESAEVKSRQKEIEKLKKDFLGELGDLETNLAELSELENKLAGEMREFNLIFKKSFEAVEAKKNEMRGLEAQKNRLQFDQEKIELRYKDLESNAKQYGRSLKEFSATAAPISFDVSEAERKLLRLRGELASIGEIDEALIKEAKETEERNAFLTKQLEDLRRAIADLKTLIRDLTEKLHVEFKSALANVNEEFNKHFRLMFNGGKAKLHLVKKEPRLDANTEANSEEQIANNEEAGIRKNKEAEFDEGGLEIEINIPRKNIKGLDMLSGGERSLVSIAAIFALISVSPPPFLVLDEVDAALDENNTKRFADLVASFANKTQFVIVTHNRATMSAADVLYGITMRADGTSHILSIKLEDVNHNLLPEKP